MPGEPVFEDFRGGDSVQRCSVVLLAPLQCLTCLAINVSGQHLQDPPKCDEVFWRSMAKLTTLRDLYINDLHMEYFGGMVELTSCKRLTHLLFDHPELSPDFELTVRLLPCGVCCSGCYLVVKHVPSCPNPDAATCLQRLRNCHFQPLVSASPAAFRYHQRFGGPCRCQCRSWL